MPRVGCTGFVIPTSRYLREFSAVEIVETAFGVPGAATVRRWAREAGDGFDFVVQAPRTLAADTWRPSAEAAQSWYACLEVAQGLSARAVLLLSPFEVASDSDARRAARALLQRLLDDAPPWLVWDPPEGWPIDAVTSVVEDLPVSITRDPFVHKQADPARTYWRMPGPVGARSRYEAQDLTSLQAVLAADRAPDSLAIFANADGVENARWMQRALAGDG